MMDTTTVLTLSDVRDNPKVMKVIVGPLRMGDHIYLKFLLRKKTGNRTEELRVDGEFRVSKVSFDTRGAAQRQLLVVEALGVTPIWKGVKNEPQWKRKMPPAIASRTIIR